MNKTELYYKVEYASQAMTEIPLGYIDKTVPGCGLTTVALENHLDTVIAVPNIELIENKLSQYPNARCNYSVLGIKSGVNTKEIEMYIAEVIELGHPVKIITTYDGLWKVKWILYKYKECRLVIDESQELLRYARLKAKSKIDAYVFDVVDNVFNIAHSFEERVSFVSATPIKLKYLPNWISNLKQVIIKWANTITISPISMERSYPKNALIKEVLNPIEKNGSVTIGGMTFSKAIIFVKSLSAIKHVADNSLISEEDIRVIMGNNQGNDSYMQGFKRLKDYGNLPKYTFVTGTGFKGIDLYDDNAVNIVISEIRKNFTMIDFSTDLKQAISRQRNKNNPNYGRFIFIYNQSSFNITEEELLAKAAEIKVKVEGALKYHFDATMGKVDKSIFDDFIVQNKDFKEYTLHDESTGYFTFNENLYQSDLEFILETRKIYEKGVNIIAEFQGNMNIGKEAIIEAPSYESIEKYFRENGNFGEYEIYTEFVDTIKTCKYYLGKTFSNHRYAINKIAEYKSIMTQAIITEVQKQFKINNRYTNTFIKETLQDVYDNNNISRKAKASDLSQFFKVQTYKGGNIRGYEIIGNREQQNNP
ncbi:hypothetical protein [Draconibacterium mangrovi]|uniref:hypothetical protein n=1 Tax=Draconibacterium mangrovi TaxID=2697469 RepID=UPI0013D50757|nr:hypothetical protein [Draconibacterium mangrovi]